MSSVIVLAFSCAQQALRLRRCPTSLHKGNKSAVLSALLLFGGLTGCSRAMNGGAEVDKESKAYKYMHPAELQQMAPALPGRENMDVTTGKFFSSAIHAPGPTLPTPVGVSNDQMPDDPNGAKDMGENAGSWVGTLDVYWKLNWIRKELLSGNVPRLLPDVVARQHRHITRILHESKHLAPDPGHYIPAGVTIQDALSYADDALKQLDAGIEHMTQMNILESAGIHTLAVTWNTSPDEVARQFAQQGLMKMEHAKATTPRDDEDASSLPAPRLHTPQIQPATRQEEAVALALKYVRTYHSSPEEMARHEFEGALRSIVRLRDLLHYEFHQPSVPGSSTMIPGLLHQEPGSMTPATPTTPKGFADPFRKSGDVSSSVVDPFRSSNESHLLR